MEPITTEAEEEAEEEAYNASVRLLQKAAVIKAKKPDSKKVGEYARILQPFNDKDLKTIKYYNPGSVS